MTIAAVAKRQTHQIQSLAGNTLGGSSPLRRTYPVAHEQQILSQATTNGHDLRQFMTLYRWVSDLHGNLTEKQFQVWNSLMLEFDMLLEHFLLHGELLPRKLSVSGL